MLRTIQSIHTPILLLFVGAQSFNAHGKMRWAWSGILSSRSEHFFTELGTETQTFDQWIEVNFKNKIRWKKHHRLILNPNISHKLTTSSPKEKFIADLPNGYYQYLKFPFRLRAGMNTYNFGVMEGYSPANRLNPIQFTEPLTPRKLGTGSMDLRYEFTNFWLDLVYIPFQRKALFPGHDSRWLPRNFTFSLPGFNVVSLPDDTNYSFSKDEVLNDSLKHNLALHMGFQINGTDLHLTYFRGNSSTPNIEPTVSVTPIGNQLIIDPNITLKTIFYLQEVFGLGIVWAKDQFILRMETSYSNTLSNVEASPWSWQSVLGIESNLSLGSQTLTIITQGYYAIHGDPLTGNQVNSSYRIFDRAGLLGLRWNFTEQSHLTFKALQNFHSHSLYGGLEIFTFLTEKLSLQASTEAIQGPNGSLLGTYRDNDRIWVNLSYFLP